MENAKNRECFSASQKYVQNRRVIITEKLSKIFVDRAEGNDVMIKLCHAVKIVCTVRTIKRKCRGVLVREREF